MRFLCKYLEISLTNLFCLWFFKIYPIWNILSSICSPVPETNSKSNNIRRLQHAVNKIREWKPEAWIKTREVTTNILCTDNSRMLGRGLYKINYAGDKKELVVEIVLYLEGFRWWLIYQWYHQCLLCFRSYWKVEPASSSGSATWEADPRSLLRSSTRILM